MSKANLLTFVIGLMGIIYIQSLRLHPSESMENFPHDKIGFDEIYVVNLKRRPERRERLIAIFNTLKLNVTFWEAVDGQNMTKDYLDHAGVTLLPGYLDPDLQRPMTFGEVGCFLSHYNIWKDIEKKGYKKALILEDDAKFIPRFRRQWCRIFADVQEFVSNWDLLYLGRKRNKPEDEYPVNDCNYLVWPNYSYWTVAYAITYTGVKKLLHQKPLTKMITLDEFLPTMFDKNPEGGRSWNKKFFPRNLIALSTNPLLIEPAWYSGNPGHYTDTNDAYIVLEDERDGDDQQIIKDEL